MAKRKKTHYYHIRFFDKYFRDFKKSQSEFWVIKTTNSRKLVTDKTNLLFNEKGNTDNRLLSLINHVRRDAQRYLDKNAILSDEYFEYYGLLEKPVLGEVIYKVDLKAAYWTYALNKTIISEDTNNKFLKFYEGEPIEDAKQARLTALGSLSTEKWIRHYVDGELIDEEVVVEPTKDLYIEINRGVDALMKEAGTKIRGAFYYYWDCIFMKKEFSEEAIDFFLKRGFKVGIQETRLEFISIAGRGYLLAEDGIDKEPKMYMCRREDKHLIEHLL